MLNLVIRLCSARLSGLGVSATADLREGERTVEDISKGVPNGEHIAAAYESSLLPHGEYECH